MKLIRGKGRRAGIISVSSVALPLVLGAALSVLLYPTHGRGVSRLAFALFIGVSMSVTAFPVLARILTERNMHFTPLGVLALACAAVDDILAWSLLAVTTAVATGSDQTQLARVALESLVFVAFMLRAVRPVLRRLLVWYERVGRLTPDMLAVVLVGLLLSAWATDRIGIHFIFGAFIFGAAMPREGAAALSRDILDRLEQVAVLLLLPIFFVTTGLKVDVRALDVTDLGELALILLVACTAKFFGAAGAARALGLRSRTAAAIGVLMNTRGLTELVVLNVGFERGILDRSLLTMLVIMAVVTTVITEPALRAVYPDRLVERDVAQVERNRLAALTSFRVLVVVDDLHRARPPLDLGVDIVDGHAPAEVVLSHFRPSPIDRAELGSGLAAELADMATRLEELQTLAAVVERRGVPAAVLSGFSVDVRNDVIEQAARLRPDVLIIGPGDHASRVGWRPDLLDGAAGKLVIVRSGDPGADLAGQGPVVVVTEGGQDADATLALAAHVARSRGTELRLVNGGRRRRPRRLLTLASRLTDAGLGCTVEMVADAREVLTPGSGLIFLEARGEMALSAVTMGTVLLVRAAPDAPDDELDAAITHLRVGGLTCRPAPALDALG